jgi:hypothetical protein
MHIKRAEFQLAEKTVLKGKQEMRKEEMKREEAMKPLY